MMIKTFYKPESVAEAMKLKEQFGAKSCWFGNGTLINNALFGSRCERVISIEKLQLNRIASRNSHLEIGAGVTLQQMIDAPEIELVLRQAAGHLWSRNIRNMATIGGNIGANRTDSCLIPCLMALSAEVETAPGKRMSVEEYVRERHNELILKVLIPLPEGVCRVQRVARQAKGPTIITAAVYILQSGQRIKKAIIALGGIAEQVTRLTAVEQGLEKGSLADKPAIERAVAKGITPRPTLSASAAYLSYISSVTIADLVAACQEGKNEYEN
jgi:putative selenate reductase FAD-binding subunit